jgi:hypothetical protein
MFPSFPRYKEGTGGRGQVEPGPAVIERKIFGVSSLSYLMTGCILGILS